MPRYHTSVIDACQSHQIIMIGLPPNTTHITQPLDVAVIGPIKQEWRQIYHQWAGENSDMKMTSEIFIKLFHKTYQRSCTVSNIQSGFRRCGIYPFDPSAPDYSKISLSTERSCEISALEENVVHNLKVSVSTQTDLTYEQPHGKAVNLVLSC